MTKPRVSPTLRRVVREVFPDFEMKEALRLLEMGLLRIPKNLRCGAHARSTGEPCGRKALANGRCPNHGGLSTGPTEAGRNRISAFQKSRWAKWREENGRCRNTKSPS